MDGCPAGASFTEGHDVDGICQFDAVARIEAKKRKTVFAVSGGSKCQLQMIGPGAFLYVDPDTGIVIRRDRSPGKCRTDDEAGVFPGISHFTGRRFAGNRFIFGADEIDQLFGTAMSEKLLKRVLIYDHSLHPIRQHTGKVVPVTIPYTGKVVPVNIRYTGKVVPVYYTIYRKSGSGYYTIYRKSGSGYYTIYRKNGYCSRPDSMADGALRSS